MRYSHVVDPRTGRALTDRFAATVIASKGIDSDALSTAVCVLGIEKGMELIKSYQARGWIRRVDESAAP
jgi:thiamine biosynthesis lipoprotein